MGAVRQRELREVIRANRRVDLMSSSGSASNSCTKTHHPPPTSESHPRTLNSHFLSLNHFITVHFTPYSSFLGIALVTSTCMRYVTVSSRFRDSACQNASFQWQLQGSSVSGALEGITCIWFLYLFTTFSFYPIATPAPMPKHQTPICPTEST